MVKKKSFKNLLMLFMNTLNFKFNAKLMEDYFFNIFVHRMVDDIKQYNLNFTNRSL